jgi:hypothetical protein
MIGGESLRAGTVIAAGRLKLALGAAPSPWRRRRSRPERYYVGRRPEATEVYVVSAIDLQPLAHLGYRSTAVFDWGCVAAGALELAFAMLADMTGHRPTGLVCSSFCEDVVAHLDHAGFVLTDGDIAVWLMTAFIDADTSIIEPHSGRAGRRNRALAWIRARAERA